MINWLFGRKRKLKVDTAESKRAIFETEKRRREVEPLVRELQERHRINNFAAGMEIALRGGKG